MNTQKEEVNLLDIQLVATIIYIFSLFISIVLTYNDKLDILKKESLFDKNTTRKISVANRVLVVIITVLFLYISYKNIGIAKKKKKELSPFKLQTVASELSTIATIIVLYTVLISGEYSIIAGSENPIL